MRLVAPEGGLPEESLEPLLRSAQGLPLDPQSVRLDLSTLVQVGEFRAVEAEVNPWLVYDAQGEPQEGALITYYVYPAPTISKIKVSGNQAFSDRKILEASGLAVGQVYYEELDGLDVRDRIRRWLYRQGSTRAEVTVQVSHTDNGLGLTLVIDEGAPNVLARLSFVGELPVSSRQLTRWARQDGLIEGKPFAPEAIRETQQHLRERLASMQRGVFKRRRGWINARIRPAVVTGPEGTWVTYTVEPGPRLELYIDGLSWMPQRKVQQALHIDERLRLTRGFLDEAPRQLDRYLQERGFYAVQSSVYLNKVSDTRQVLQVQVQRGALHKLDVGRFPHWIGVDFQGNQALTDAALQAVLDQASPEILRQDHYTEEAMDKALSAGRTLYSAHGYQSATLTAKQPTVSPRHGVADALRALIGQPARRRIHVEVEVEDGPLTTLGELLIEGPATEVDLGYVTAEKAKLLGHAYSPLAIDRLLRGILQAHRDAGWLDVDARVTEEPMAHGARRVRLAIEPGDRVLLRSVVTRGASRTRSSFIMREVDLELGQPISAPDLDSLRRDLYDLGVFRTVDLALLGDEPARDLVIGVDERARWAFEIGGGLNTDQGVRTFGRATRRNLLGRAHRLELVGQIGLSYRSTDVRDWVPDITDPAWRAAVSYTAPRFPVRGQDLILDVVLRERRQQRTWEMDRTGGGVALETRVNHTRFRGSVRLESRKLNEIDVGALLPGEAWSSLIDVTDPALPSPWRFQDSLSAVLIHDLRDDPVQPSSGVLLALNGEWSPGLVRTAAQPQTSFVKGQVRFNGYVPFWGLVLHLSGEGAHAYSLGDSLIPLEDRYRLGGTGSMRGFQRYAVGPKNIAPPVTLNWPNGLDPLIGYVARDQGDRWVPTGGDTSALGTAELLLPLTSLGMASWEGYSGAVFADVGQVWLLDPNAQASSDAPDIAALTPAWRYAVGVGARAATPIGPIQLDLASNLQALTARGKRHALLRTAWEEPWARLHLTLGATF